MMMKERIRISMIFFIIIYLFKTFENNKIVLILIKYFSNILSITS